MGLETMSGVGSGVGLGVSRKSISINCSRSGAGGWLSITTAMIRALMATEPNAAVHQGDGARDEAGDEGSGESGGIDEFIKVLQDREPKYFEKLSKVL